MSRTLVTVNDVSLNAESAITRTALTGGVTGTNGYALVGVKASSKVRLVFENPGATGLIEIKSGNSINSDEGKLAIVIGGGNTVMALELDGSRFVGMPTGIEIDNPGVTGIMYAIQ